MLFTLTESSGHGDGTFRAPMVQRSTPSSVKATACFSLISLAREAERENRKQCEELKREGKEASEAQDKAEEMKVMAEALIDQRREALKTDDGEKGDNRFRQDLAAGKNRHLAWKKYQARMRAATCRMAGQGARAKEAVEARQRWHEMHDKPTDEASPSGHAENRRKKIQESNASKKRLTYRERNDFREEELPECPWPKLHAWGRAEKKTKRLVESTARPKSHARIIEKTAKPKSRAGPTYKQQQHEHKQQQHEHKQQQHEHKKQQQQQYPWRQQQQQQQPQHHDHECLLLEEDTVMSLKPEQPLGWQLVEATLDSGSAVSAIPKDCIADPSQLQAASDGPQSYTSASEHSCRVEGKLQPECRFQSGVQGKVNFKVLNPLKKVIISTSQLRRRGYKIVHDDISFIEDKKTGIQTKVYERNGVYIIPMYIKGIRKPDGSSFPGQA